MTKSNWNAIILNRKQKIAKEQQSRLDELSQALRKYKCVFTPKQLERIAEKAGISTITAKLYIRRGVKVEQTAIDLLKECKDEALENLKYWFEVIK